MCQEPGRAVDLAAANRFGQQLFFANMAIQRRKTPRLGLEPRIRRPQAFTPLTWRQAPLFDLDPDLAVLKERASTADSELLRYCNDVVRDHAAQHGWSAKQTNDVKRSLRLLQVLQDTPGAKINATDVAQLPRFGGSTQSTLEVLAAAGLLIDDRASITERYFAGKAEGLPAVMRAQLEIWLEVMLNGSATAPRRISRDPQTARLHILGIAPILHSWATQGHQSRAEITPEDVLAALPARGSRRNFAEQGLRSLFSVLKARKEIFSNPTRGMHLTPGNDTVPLPQDTEAIREALNSPDPAVALAVALVAFHALTGKQLNALNVTDIVDGRLILLGRTIPLASPVLPRLGSWLDYRGRTWPGTSNPHLFINRRTAPRLLPVSRAFPWRQTSLRPQALREDRILQEIHASGGDVRRICDLFGLTVTASLRYANTVEHPDLTTSRPVRSQTQDHM
jgi:hypothetical protein